MPRSHYATVHPIRKVDSEAGETPSWDLEAKALRYFHATTIPEAAQKAHALLSSANSCPRCLRAIAQLYERLGSTLFLDDDPQDLLEAFEPADQNPCTLRILAATILLEGRERILVTLHRDTAAHIRG